MAVVGGGLVAKRMDDLVRSACAVVVEPGGTTGAGTAFRIAPEYAVTAAHVVKGKKASRWDLRFSGGGRAQAEVVAVSDGLAKDKTNYPLPDIAVLKLTSMPDPDAPCVMLGEPVPQGDMHLRYCGFDPDMTELAFERHFERHDVVLQDEGLGYWRLDQAAIRPGRSGGPVYSLVDGVVLGFVKASLHPNVPIGGYCVPLLSALRLVCRDNDDLYRDIVHSHDAYHVKTHLWRLLPCGDTAARDRFVKMVDLLSRAADPPISEPAICDLYDGLFPYAVERPAERQFVALRDLAEYILREVVSRSNELPAAVRLCLRVTAWPDTPAEVAEALWRIAEELAVVQGLTLPTGSAPTAADNGVDTVIGVLMPAQTAVQDGDPHHWELFLHRRDEVEPWRVGESVSYADAAESLRAALHEYLSTTARIVDIEIALPDDFIATEQLHGWRRRPDDPADLSRFSDRHPIMPRRSRIWDRTTEQREAMRAHLAQLQNSEGRDLAWLPCRDQRDAQALHNFLLGHHGLGVDGHPSGHAFDTTASQSFPLMVWRGSDCADHDAAGAGRPCAGTRFRDSLISNFAGRPPTEWTEEINSMHTDLVRDKLKDTDSRHGWREVVFVLERPTANRRLVPLGGGLGGSR